MTVESTEGIYTATYWRDLNCAIHQYRLIWNNGNGWNNTQVGNRTHAFTLSGGGTKKIPISRPKIAVENKDGKTKIYYICRDEEYQNKVLLYLNEDFNNNSSSWKKHYLTAFEVGAWEPSYDYQLWKDKQLLHIFVQNTAQGAHETISELDPQMIYLMEVNE